MIGGLLHIHHVVHICFERNDAQLKYSWCSTPVCALFWDKRLVLHTYQVHNRRTGVSANHSNLVLFEYMIPICFHWWQVS